MIRRPFRRLAAVVLLALGLPASAVAAMLERPAAPAPTATWNGDDTVRLAQGGGCSAAAAQAAAQSGGQVLSVRTSQQGDRTVCIVTVLIPASDGNRPRRQTITIEQ